MGKTIKKNFISTTLFLQKFKTFSHKFSEVIV